MEAAARATHTSSAQATAMTSFMDALRELGVDEPGIFGARMEEFAYLANVLLAGHERDGARLGPRASADAVLSTVCFGTIITLRAPRARGKRKRTPAPADFAKVLRRRTADWLFRIGSSALVTGAAPRVKGSKESGLLYSAEELETAIQ
jgi:hypothetical protein